MTSLRTVSTRRLVAISLGALAVVGGGGAIALAGGNGDKPPAKPLAQAVHEAITAPAVQGVTADIKFSNRLIDASSLQGSDPILSGATGRLWATADHRVRLELQSDAGDAQIVSDGKTVSVYDHASKTVYRATLPAEKAGAKERAHAAPTVADIQAELAKLMKESDVSGALPGNVAGRPAYTVRLSPKHSGGLLGAAEVAWDAATGAPLRAAIYAQGSDRPVLELEATNIKYGPVAASAFNVGPPAGVKAVTLDTGKMDAAHRTGQEKAPKPVTGVAAVSKALPFTLTAPDTLVGLPRQEVRLLDWKGTPAALVTYGQGLGGIAVIQQATDTAAKKPAAPKVDRHGHDEAPGLSLPTVAISPGVTGQELDTALGTMVQFSRGGVDYIVVGSVPAAAAEAAARGL
jgi:outer membrane lipoprotein-sorting protein